MTKQISVDDYPMTPRRRELFLRIVDGFRNYHQITQALFFLDEHFPPDKLDRAMAWLILNGSVGAKFMRFFTEECASSNLELHRMLLSVVDNKDRQQLIAGRNFKV